jgi:hypothetical protein
MRQNAVTKDLSPIFANRTGMIGESFVLLVDFAIERVRVRLGVEGGFSIFHDVGKFLAVGII